MQGSIHNKGGNINTHSEQRASQHGHSVQALAVIYTHQWVMKWYSSVICCFLVRLQATAVTTSPEDSMTQDSHCPILAIFLFRWPALLALQDYKLQQLSVASTADLQSQTLQCSDLKKKENKEKQTDNFCIIFTRVIGLLSILLAYPYCTYYFFFIYPFLFACHHTVTIHFLYFYTCVDVTRSHVM